MENDTINLLFMYVMDSQLFCKDKILETFIKIRARKHNDLDNRTGGKSVVCLLIIRTAFLTIANNEVLLELSLLRDL